MRVPQQFNFPPLPSDPTVVPSWFTRFLERHGLAFKRVSLSLPGPTTVAVPMPGVAATIKPYTVDLLTIALTANIVLTLDQDTRPGAEGLLELTQDATGGRTVTFVNALTVPTVSTTALKRTLLGATYNGSGWVLRTLASGY